MKKEMKKITAKEFKEMEGFWNGKMYANGVVYKNNQAYQIIDPENLKAEKKNEVVMAAEKLADYAKYREMNTEDVRGAVQYISYALLNISEKDAAHKEQLFAIAKQLHDLEAQIIHEQKESK